MGYIYNLVLPISLLLVVSTAQQYNNGLPGVSSDAVKPTCVSGTPGVISVTGNGQALATSDVGTVNLMLNVQSPTANEARQIASNIADALVSSLSKVNGIFADNITSTQVSVNSNTEYNSTTSASTVVGYTFANNLAVRIGDLTSSKLSQVLDTAVANGGNNLTISSVDFSLSPQLSRSKTLEAQQAASDDARSSAQQFAKGMGVNLGAVLSIVDESSSLNSYSFPYISGSSSTYGSKSSSSSGYAGAPAGSASSSSTPGSIGSQTVQARILVVYSVCNPNA